MSTPASASHWRRSMQRFVRDPLAMASLLFILALMAVALFAPVTSRYDPIHQDLLDRFSGPSADHWLGTDNLGRDTWARLVYGARVSLLITLSSVLIATIIAVPIGLVSGYWSGKVDTIVMRLTDALLSIPPLVLALAIAGILGAGTRNLVIALVVVIVPGFVRLVRGQALAVREEGYVDASRAIGTSTPVILARRVLPHVLSPLLVQVSIALGTILVVEASLSFLGLGDPPPDASWGGMLLDGFTVMATDARLVIVPGLAIALATLAFNAVGDGARDALAGTALQRRRRGDVLGTTSVVERGPDPGGAPRDGAARGEDVRDDGALLDIRGLRIGFDTGSGMVTVLDGVDLHVGRGEILGLVGESGCGKTVTAQSILRLLPSPPARILGGEVRFEGADLLSLSSRELRRIRGNDIAMVFQDPMASLNPAFTIGDQLVEAQRLHRDISRKDARARAASLLDRVGIPDAARRVDEYPHTFSGGMRQRALIAMALANDPKLLIADEPTTALDVTVQAQILELIHQLRDELGMSVLFVTHDLGVVQDLCDRVAVMYAGQVVETTSVREIFAEPRHPYSVALLQSRPELGGGQERLVSIPGVVPAPTEMPEGCRFHTRCPLAVDACLAPVPIEAVGDRHLVRCIRHGEVVTSRVTEEFLAAEEREVPSP
jgi:peptide/nickel transport system permease protein